MVVPFLFAANAGEFGGRGFRLTGEEAMGDGLRKDKKDEMLRLAAKVGRTVAACLEEEEREESVGGRREGSILLDFPDSAIDYSLASMYLAQSKDQSGNNSAGTIS